jgi:hypothetical protein
MPGGASDHEFVQPLRGTTLLHIIGQDPEGFGRHLEAVTSRMLRGRSVMELARRTETYLLQNAGRLLVVSRDEVAVLIEQLGASRAAKRRLATKTLADYGTSVLPYLTESLSRGNLDAEQRARVEMLVERCPRVDEDTPSSLACLLSADRDHWQILAKRMDRAQFLAVNDHIQRCGLESLQR